MGTKAKVALLVLMVGLVVAIIVWDKKFGQAPDSRQTDIAALPEGSTAPTDPFATLVPAAPDTAPPAPDPFSTPPPAAPPPAVVTPPPTTVTPPAPATPAGPSVARNPFDTTTPAPAGNPFDAGTRPSPVVVEPDRNPTTSSRPITPPPPAGAKTYKVQEGDSLWIIAERHYKNGAQWKLIEDANKDRLGDRGFLKVGMDLIIPEISAASVPASASVSREAAGPGEYKVREGDSLSSIAKDLLGSESLWESIAKANEDKLEGKPNRLKVGMILRIPPKTETVHRTAPPKPVKQPDLKEEPIPADLAGKRTYRIKSGDSLWKIAERELGDGLKWEKLYEANRGRLPSKTDLRVGQLIVIPD